MSRETERHEQRLQKILAAAGVASRRKAEELILAGRVLVNGQPVTRLGSKADPDEDHIRIDGRPLKLPGRPRYYMLNKPRDVVTTVSDPQGRPTVMKFLPRDSTRVFPVGRLDYQSEGLLLLTDDGELANALTHAASRVEKTYLVKVARRPSADALEQLRRGVMIEKGRRGAHSGRVMTQPARIALARNAENPWYEVVLVEGINRELRKMFEEVGHFVEKIRRVGFGPLVLDIEPGQIRELTADEVVRLRKAARPRAAKQAGVHANRPRIDEKAAAKRGKSGAGNRPRTTGGGATPAEGLRQSPRANKLGRASQTGGSHQAERPTRPERPARPARPTRPARRVH